MCAVDETADTRAQVGQRIQRARLGAGYTVAAEFARACGVQPNTVYRWERGDLVPDIFRLEQIATVARVSTDWLLRGDAPSAAPASLEAWRLTPRGQTASSDAMAFLRSLPLGGYEPPSAVFWDLALLAHEQGLTPSDAALAARLTETKKPR